MSKITVVVPVYNVEDCLAQCLDSIRSQTLEDIEVVCIDDGSTDDSPSILSKISQRDKRIRVIAKENGGLSSARNVGIEVASGSYVMFVDSDDYLEANACQTVFEAFEDGSADIITFGAKCFPKEDSYPWLEECLSPRNAAYNTFCMDILFEERSHPYVWRSAFSKVFLDSAGLRFREDVRFGEDQVFHFMAYPRAGGVRFLSDKLYNYRVARQNSLMNMSEASIERKILHHIKIIDVILADWEEQGWLCMHREQMIGWALEFVLLDVYRSGGARTDELLQLLGRTLAPYIPDLDSFIAGNGEKAILRKLVSGMHIRLSRVAVYRYYLEKRGLRACCYRMIRSVLPSKSSARTRKGV